MLVQQTGDIQHKLSEKEARPATILKIGKIAKTLMHGPFSIFTAHSTPNEQLVARNMTQSIQSIQRLNTKNVWKVIGSEIRKKESIYSDITSL